MATERTGTWFCVITLCALMSGVMCGCPPGKFGWKCNVECRCKTGSNSRCDEVTGQCEAGCNNDSYGPHCLFKKNCIYDVVGRTYTGTMNTTKSGHKCLRWDYNSAKFLPGDDPKNYCRNPKLPNLSGYAYHPWCYIDSSNSADGHDRSYEECDLASCDCPKYLFGQNCKYQCHCRNEIEVCHSRSGRCQSGCAPGWVGSSCQTVCKKGMYGIGCQHSCDNCHNNDCNPETGECLSGCRRGFSGYFCSEKCKPRRFGRNCAFFCGKCKFGDTCDPVSGKCLRGCAAGYDSSDPTCKTKCDRMRFGLHCSGRCGYCKDGESCHHETGVCDSGCKAGYYGDGCDKSCPDQFYGKGCTQKCGACRDNTTCDKAYGYCLYGCADGYTGHTCRTAMIRTTEASTTWTVGIAAAIGAFLVILIIVVIIIVVQRRRCSSKKMNNSKSFLDETKEDGCSSVENERCMLLGDSRFEQTELREIEENSRNEELSEPIYVNVNGRKRTAAVKLEDLHAYILKNKDNNCDGFRKEFEELPMGLLALCEVARRPENKAKNRYGNIVAYDHSRVVLEPLTNEPHSDYVNASFMDGYNRPKAFIASQGPNKTMIRDFWRMVWQHRVSKIVMLTNLVEACKKKCEQYWPDEGTMKYGDVSVRIVDTAKYTDFIIRTFEISKDENSRIVKQFHFCTWSDHGAPTYPTTLLAFRRKVQSFSPDNTAPILCHCSAGIGRTGTYIGLHYLLDQANNEGQVDVLQAAHNMRGNRVNMIQTCEQYMFVYDALLEAVIAGDTTIPKSSFRATFEEMSQNENGSENPLEKQYDTVQLLSPTIDRSECTAALSEDNMAKNRFKNVLPANRSRPFLYTPIDGCNDYINAIFLSGYTQKDRFLVTQMPLPNTVADFWRMLYDYNSDAIVMLNEFDRNDKSCALYWPEEYGYTEEHGPLSVELLSSSDVDPDVTLRIFKLSHHGRGEERAVKQFMFKPWPDYQSLPNAVTSLLRLHRMVNDWYKQNGKGPVTIHCMNGASKSGILVAVSLILERLELDLEVDVYQTLKQIRVHRPQFIESFEQYQFLYQAVLEYLDSLE
ncbi:receptor-type tyrosine-protein phosphatase epsilon-like [Babylonia areolata]|uniref:receptor-type tyrosine-protein phosphatase epsilon-like n=1 Tax=Babylonia areolata TaxID=304850 RepID=UPI003FD0BB55